MKRLLNYLAGVAIAALLFSGGLAQAQSNPTLYTFESAISCNWLYTLGHVPVDPEYHIVNDDPFPFGDTQNFEVYSTPTSIEITRSDAGSDLFADWSVISGLQPIAVIVSGDFNDTNWNAYVYDPTLAADTRLHNGGLLETDAEDIQFMKFCFAPPEPPGGGCTLTQGYWKTHSEYGPAPYDDTWAELPNGADTPFFDTPVSWYEMFHTPPRGGNKYISLAHQWMAATLNGLADADLSEVASEMADAQTLLDDYDGDWDNPRGYSRDIRDQMNALANTLDDYNNGNIGPGHCDDGGRIGESATATGDPQTFMRTTAYPNPFNPRSQFELSVIEEQQVSAELFNMLGQRVATLFNGTVQVGQTQQVTIDGSNLPSGMYLVRITGERFADTFRVTLLK